MADSSTITVKNTGGSLSGKALDGVNLGAAGVVTNDATILGGSSGVIAGPSSTVENTGTIIGTSLNGVALTATGTVINAASGVITGGNAGVVVAATGKLANAGAITGTHGDGVTLAATGTVTNTANGTIVGGTAGIVGAATGVVSNAGAVTGLHGNGIDLAAAGTVINLASGTIAGSANGIVEAAAGVVVNAGTITGGLLDGVDLTGGGTVTNAGLISGGNGTAVYLGGVGANRLVVEVGATFAGKAIGGVGATNTLELGAGTGSLTNFGGNFVNFQAIVVDAGAHWVLTGGNPLAPGAFTLGVGATLSYNGVIYGTAIVQAPSTLTLAAGSSFDNLATIGGLTGVTAGANSALLNTGSIGGSTLDGIDAGAGATISNDVSGVITGAQAGLVLGANASVHNANIIVGTHGDGIDAGAGSTLTNTDAVTGGQSGIVGGAGIVVTNSGDITGTGVDGVNLAAAGVVTNAGLIAGASSGVIEAAGSTVENTGTITGTLLSGVSLAATGTVVNAMSGVIIGNTAGVVEAATGKLSNAGVITGLHGDGADLAATGTVINTATGTITGAQNGVVEAATGLVINAGSIVGRLQDGVDLTAGGTVNNAGLISGGNGTAVYLGGSGANLLVVDPGAVFVGQAIGSATAANTLEFAAGNGSLTNFGGTFINFQTIVVDAGAHWVVTDALPIAAGAITVAAGASLTYNGVVYGTPIVQTAGTVTLGASATYENSGTAGGAVGLVAGANTAVLNTGNLGGSVLDGADLGAGATLVTTNNLNGNASGVVGGANNLITNTAGYAASTISGTIYNDVNGDGVEQTAESGLSGQTVNLLSGTTVVATATTSATGTYSFTNLAPGSYSVQVIKPSGETFSTPGTTAVTVTFGSATIVNAGEYLPSTVSGTVFNDVNASGTQQSAESGLSGQTVNLLSGTTVVATATTSATGTYSFGNLAPGSYSVQVIKPSGETFSTPGTTAVTVTSGSTSIVNAGEYLPSTVSGTVFNDVNASGTQQTGDVGLAGQTVNLLSGSTVVATATTSATGTYSFGNLAPGSYSVQVIKPSGETFSIPGTTAVTVTSGSASIVNAGEYLPSIVSGTVFNDVNASGTQQTGDVGLAGQTVNLLSGTTVVATAATSATGTYSFGNLAPGSYSVQVIKPTGETFSTPGTTAVTVTSGSSTTVDVGEFVATVTPALGTISSMVFLDGLADGTYHVGDPGVAGVTVKLLNAQGVFTGATTTTDSYGRYSFTGVAPGTYQVQVVAPSGMSYSTVEHASGNSLLDSDVNSRTGLSNTFTVQSAQTTTGENAGLVFNGHFAGTTPIILSSGQAYAGNAGSGVVIGSGNDNVHTGSGGNNIVVLGGGNNIVEAGSGRTDDIATSVGSLNAQTQNAANGFLFAGTGDSTLQGEGGNAYLVAGKGNNMVAGGTANNVLVGGISRGTVTAVGSNVTSYTTGSEVRLTGTSAEVLYQKGDGVQVLDNTFDPTKDSLKIFGYTGGTMQTLHGQEVLYLGGNDLIIFNGGTPAFTNGTGSTFAGVTFNPNIAAAPESVVSFGADGLPTIVAAGGATVTAPITPPAVTTPPGPTPVPPHMGTPIPPVTPPPPSVPPVTPPVAPVAVHAVTMSGWNQSLTLDNQSYAVTGSQGNATITAGNGNDTVSASGYNNTIKLGDGNDTVTGPQGNSTVTVGNGDSTITLQGYGNVITTGAGTNTIHAGDGNATVNTGSGNDTVMLSGWTNFLVGGIGHDSFIGGAGNTYQVNDVGSSGGMTIQDFSLNNGDSLDLSKVLAHAGWNDAASTLAGYLKVSQSGSDAVVSIDKTGHGGSFSAVATLHGLGSTTLGDLQSHHSIGLF